MSYHPNYFEGGNAVRAECAARLECLRTNAEGRTMFDVGCSEGYNAFGLSGSFDDILAVDNVGKNIAYCRKLAQQHAVLNIRWEHGDFMDFLDGRWDCVLYLSVHHHLCGQLGMEKASEVLGALSERGEMMLIDMGQKNEQGVSQYGWWRALPPTGGQQEEWMRSYLLENTRYMKAKCIGTFPIHGVRRFLWKLEI